MNPATFTTQRPVATGMLFLAIIMLGVVSLARLPVDLLPDISFPRLVVYTTYRDAGPREIEERISVLIEQAVSTVGGLRRLSSISRDGVSVVTLEFLWGTKMDFAALQIREKLDQIRWQLPPQADRPTLLRQDPREQPIMMLAVVGEDLYRLRELSRQVFKRRLEQIEGIALATVTGGFEREIQIEINMARLAALGLSLEKVEQTLKTASDNRPGGTIRKGQFRYGLRTLGEFTTVAEIGAVAISLQKGGTVTLREVASITDGFRERAGLTRYNGKEAIGLLLTKESGTNTVAVTRRVLEVLEQLRREYPQVTLAVVDAQAGFIESAIGQVEQELIAGGILAFLVLVFFLRDLRTPLIIAVAMPVSVIAAFALFYFFGINLNVISLGGLALGIGMLMDNSIVVLENIFRRRDEGQSLLQATIDGTGEVIAPVTSSTLTNIAVFLPLAYVHGIAGQLFRDQSFAIAFALLASLLVAFALLPMLASRLLRREGKKESGRVGEGKNLPLAGSPAHPRARAIFKRVTSFIRDLFFFWKDSFLAPVRRLERVIKKATTPLLNGFDRLYTAFAQRYETILAKALEKPRQVLALTFCAFLFSFILAIFGLGRELMPQVDQRQFLVDIELPPGATLSATVAATENLEKILLREAEVAAVFAQVGRVGFQFGGTEEQGLERATFLVQIKESAPATEEIMARLRERLLSSIHSQITLRRPQSQFANMLGLAEADVTIQIRGPEISAALAIADTLRRRCANIVGLADLRSDFAGGQQEMVLTIDRHAAAQYGVAPMTIATFVENYMRGTVPTTFKDFDQKISILLRAQESDRKTIDQLLQSPVPTTNGQTAPLRRFVSANMNVAPTAIFRENQARTLSLYGNVSGRDLEVVAREVEKLIAKLKLPAGYEVRLAGQRTEMRQTFWSMAAAIALAIALMYMILAAEFESLKYPFIIMLAAPLAIIGVVFGLLITHQTLNLMSLIGLMVLVGIVDNDAIVKVDFILQERKRGTPLREAILLAGQKRLRPIVMNTVTTIFGMLPMLIYPGTGTEFYRPLAVAVIFGLLFATALTLVVVPVVVWGMER
jgi:HAE1 family hydrophobic/amphiphilic exporter-1